MSIRDTRLANLKLLVAESGSVANLGRASGVNATYLRQVLRGDMGKHRRTARQLGDAAVERLEDGCFKPRGWMDETHAAAVTLPNATSRAALLTLEELIGRLGPGSRRAVGGLLADWALDPAANRNIARAIEVLLQPPAEPTPVPLPSFASPSAASGETDSSRLAASVAP